MAKHTNWWEFTHQQQLIALPVPMKANFQALQSEAQVIRAVVAILKGTLLNQCIIRHCLVDSNTITVAIFITIAAINKPFDVHSNLIFCQAKHVQSFVCIVNHFFFHTFWYSACANNQSLKLFQRCKFVAIYNKMLQHNEEGLIAAVT